MNPRSGALKAVLPILVLAVGAIGAFAMYMSRSEPETTIPEVPVPLVRVQEIELRELQLSVESQGTVSPRTESVLVPEIAGRVIWVAPSFASGGFFEADEPLLRIDPHDYRQAVVRARAEVARAELRLAQEKAEAEVARREWKELGVGEATPLTLHEPQLAEAEATLEASRAALRQAERNLDRTEIRAPYAGRVRTKQVDVGQHVTPGTPLAMVYAVDFAEIRLPLPDGEMAFLDLPLDYRGETGRRSGPEVILRAEFAGRTHEWEGRIVRTEGEIDPRSRMVHAVARVGNPYARGDDPDRPPLAAGMFVDAEILGRVVDGVAVVPRASLRQDGRVLVVDEGDRLRLREVEVLRRTPETVIVSAGLAAGERLCITPLAAVTDGMRVRTSESS